MMFETGLAVAFACVLMALAHYFPWRSMIGRELPVLAKYMLGVLSMLVPLSVVWHLRSDWATLQLVWSVVGASGLVVFALHVIDAAVDGQHRADQAEREGDKLRGKINQDR